VKVPATTDDICSLVHCLKRCIYTMLGSITWIVVKNLVNIFIYGE